MVPPTEKTATLNFRTSDDVVEMLKQLAESAGMNMTEFVETVIRVQYRQAFPEKAHAYETAAERLERQLLSLTHTSRQAQYRAELDAAWEDEKPGSKVKAALRSMMATRGTFDVGCGSDRTIAVGAEEEALRCVRAYRQQPTRQTEEIALRELNALSNFYMTSPNRKRAK